MVPRRVGLPNLLARSPLADVGWKKRRSYCSGDSERVMLRVSSLEDSISLLS